MSVYGFIRPVPRIASRVPSPGSRRRGCTPRCYQISQVSRCHVLFFFIFLLPSPAVSKRLSTRLPVLSGYAFPPFHRLARSTTLSPIRSAGQPKIRSSLTLTSTAAAWSGRAKPLSYKEKAGDTPACPFHLDSRSHFSHQRLVTKPRTCRTVQALPHTICYIAVDSPYHIPSKSRHDTSRKAQYIHQPTYKSFRHPIQLGSHDRCHLARSLACLTRDTVRSPPTQRF